MAKKKTKTATRKRKAKTFRPVKPCLDVYPVTRTDQQVVPSGTMVVTVDGDKRVIRRPLWPKVKGTVSRDLIIKAVKKVSTSSGGRTVQVRTKPKKKVVVKK